jgi:MFS superfamily sulfate permease-like transporter
MPFLAWWPMVNRGTLREDFMAGLTGAVVVLPQGVAFATIAGMPPEYGLYAGIVPAIIAALFGSSWHLVSGPTTAASLVLFSILSTYAEPGSAPYVQLAFTLTFMVGLIELSLGLARLGALVNFISHSVVIGFTAGAAILIATNQVKNFFGLSIPRGASFVETWQTLFTHLDQIGPYVTTVSLVTLLIGILVRRFLPRWPYMIIAMLGGSVLGILLQQAGVKTISTVGALPSALPPLSMPTLSFDSLRDLFSGAVAVTLLALTEAVSIARAMAGVLFLVAWGLIDFHHIRQIIRTSRAETAILLITFVATLSIALEEAIVIGVLLSLVIYLSRTSRPRVVKRVPDPQDPKRKFTHNPALPECPQMKIVRVDGSLFFGAVSAVQESFRLFEKKTPSQKHLVVVASPINFVDVAGAEFLATEAKRRRAQGGGLYFIQLKSVVLNTLRKGGFMETINEENSYRSKSEAIASVFSKLDPQVCRNCRLRVFNECAHVLRAEAAPPRNHTLPPETNRTPDISLASPSSLLEATHEAV